MFCKFIENRSIGEIIPLDLIQDLFFLRTIRNSGNQFLLNGLAHPDCFRGKQIVTFIRILQILSVIIHDVTEDPILRYFIVNTDLRRSIRHHEIYGSGLLGHTVLLMVYVIIQQFLSDILVIQQELGCIVQFVIASTVILLIILCLLICLFIFFLKIGNLLAHRFFIRKFHSIDHIALPHIFVAESLGYEHIVLYSVVTGQCFAIYQIVRRAIVFILEIVFHNSLGRCALPVDFQRTAQNDIRETETFSFVSEGDQSP